MCCDCNNHYFVGMWYGPVSQTITDQLALVVDQVVPLLVLCLITEAVLTHWRLWGKAPILYPGYVKIFSAYILHVYWIFFCQKSLKPLALQQCSQLNCYGNQLFPTATNYRCPSYIAVLRIKDKLHLKRINFYNATKIAGCKF